MQISIQTSGVILSEPLIAHVEQRLLFALGRFQAHVIKITVDLSTSGTTAAGNNRCHLRIRLHGLPDIAIEDSEGDICLAIDRAAARAGRTLGRQLQRTGQAFDTPPDRDA